eukprot:gene11961-biopygen6415
MHKSAYHTLQHSRVMVLAGCVPRFGVSCMWFLSDKEGCTARVQTFRLVALCRRLRRCNSPTSPPLASLAAPAAPIFLAPQKAVQFQGSTGAGLPRFRQPRAKNCLNGRPIRSLESHGVHHFTDVVEVDGTPFSPKKLARGWFFVPRGGLLPLGRKCENRPPPRHPPARCLPTDARRAAPAPVRCRELRQTHTSLLWLLNFPRQRITFSIPAGWAHTGCPSAAGCCCAQRTRKMPSVPPARCFGMHKEVSPSLRSLALRGIGPRGAADIAAALAHSDIECLNLRGCRIGAAVEDATNPPEQLRASSHCWRWGVLVVVRSSLGVSLERWFGLQAGLKTSLGLGF